MEIDITLVALLATSIATIVYATLTYFLLREMRREKEKPIIEEILGVVLYPLLGFLEEEVSYFKKGDTMLSFVRGKFTSGKKISNLFSWGVEQLVYEAFRKSHSNIAKMIDNHDAFVNELKDDADSIAEVLYTTKFRKKCSDMIIKWGEKADEKDKILSYVGKRDPAEYLLGYTVNNILSLPDGNAFCRFWEKNREKFMKENMAKKQCEKLKDTLIKIEDITKKLTIRLQKLIDRYEEKYGIPKTSVADKYLKSTRVI